MKKLWMIMLLAGSVFAGCSATQEGQGTAADSAAMDSVSTDTMMMDTTTRDTVVTDTAKRDSM